MSLFCSSYTGRDDRSRHAEAREAQRALGDGTRFPWLPGHGHLFFPSSPCKPSSNGIQIPVSTLGARSPSAHFAGVVGRPSRHFARAAGSPSSDGCRMRFCLGVPPLQFSGDGVVVLKHLSDTYLHRNIQLEPILLAIGCHLKDFQCLCIIHLLSALHLYWKYIDSIIILFFFLNLSL